MMTEKSQCAIGTDIVTVKPDQNGTFRCYLTDRPAHTSASRAAETVMDVSIILPQPPRTVWPLFKDFNLWMNRFGYFWDGLPADNEDRFVYLGNRGAKGTLKYAADGASTRYVVRKVIEGQLIYFDRLPLPIPEKKAPGAATTS